MKKIQANKDLRWGPREDQFLKEGEVREVLPDVADHLVEIGDAVYFSDKPAEKARPEKSKAKGKGKK